MSKDKVLDNYTESKLVRFFVAYLEGNWVYGTLGYTDFDFRLLEFSEFVDAIKREIEFTNPYEKNSEERLLPFKIFLLYHNELSPFEENTYFKYIEEPGALVFCTQDEFKGLECLDKFKDSDDGKQFFG